jgi:crossover junction endodeoxyribonuclease RuvC
LQKSTKIILGIDPGTIIMGYGLIQVEKTTMKMIDMGVLKLATADGPYERLQKIHNKVIDLISLHQLK